MTQYKEFSLEGMARNLGLFPGRKVLFEITYESDFEGYYGKASESWEHKIVVKTNEVKNDNGTIIWPETITIGKRFDDIDDVLYTASVNMKTALAAIAAKAFDSNVKNAVSMIRNIN